MRCHSCPAAQKDYTTMSQTKDICKQYNKETDTIEILHDSDIAQGTQQTTMANTGCVQGWDANGNAIFIPRDSVLQILAEVINANSQSTITTLFGMNGSGAGATPAAINMANLASVLGGIFKIEYGRASGSISFNYISGILIVGTTWSGGNIYTVRYNGASKIAGGAEEVSVSTSGYTTTITGDSFCYFAIITNQ